MVVIFSWIEVGLFCHEHARVEKLDNGSPIHLSWGGAGEKL
ncbi:MAG TPA: hypothetical protein VK770_15745 [Candidatus Acidoferrum sp.]|jgi:hypothetical protein|nr:hypothetical protein [Candidatus Acidoferrum sp.]